MADSAFDEWDWRRRRQWVIPFVVHQLILFLEKPHRLPALMTFIARLLNAYAVPSALVSIFNHFGLNPSAKRAIKDLVRRLGSPLLVEDVAGQLVARGAGGWQTF